MKMSAICGRGNATPTNTPTGAVAKRAVPCGLRQRDTPLALRARISAHQVAPSATSRFGAQPRAAVAVVTAWPDCLRRHPDRLGDQLLHCGPLLLQRLAGRRGMVAICNRQSRQILPALLQGSEHVRRVPVIRFRRAALAAVPCFHATFSPENYGRCESPCLAKRREGDLFLAQKCRDFEWCATDVT